MHQVGRVRRERKILFRFITLLLSVLLAACSGSQSALDPTGDKAVGISWLFWLFTGVCLVVFVAVVAVLLLGVARRRKSAPESATADPAQERRMGVAVGIATGTTVLTLIV